MDADDEEGKAMRYRRKVRCWECGEVIPVEDAVRVDVTTGRYTGSWREGLWPARGSTWRRVDMCEECAGGGGDAFPELSRVHYLILLMCLAVPLSAVAGFLLVVLFALFVNRC
jgi:hypothetical protein